MIFAHPSFPGKIGVARADITPPIGIYARNWGAAAHDVAEGIHRPLHVTVMSLQGDGGGAPVILASLDLGWWKDPADEYYVRGALLEELGLESSRVLVNLSHTHAGPSICRGDAHRAGGHLVPPYLDKVRDTLVATAREALANARNATLEWSTGWSGLAQDRDLKDPDKDRYVCGYNPGAPADGTLLVGRVSDATGKLLAVITNYACHPTTLAWENRLISPDWCGAFHETVENATGATSLFLQGASGELQPRECFTGNLEIAEAHGRELGYAVLSTLAGMQPPASRLEYAGVVESGAPLATWRRVPGQGNGTLTTSEIRVDLPLKDMPTVAEIESELAACEDRVLGERLFRKKMVRSLVGDGDSCQCPVWIWHIGDAILVAQREEAYSIFQRELRATYPDKPLIVMNLTNGSCGYLTPREYYDRDLYQVWQSPYERGCLEIMTETVKAALAS